jgi:NAD(P)-dependent dehydrogenase (short-subunit alcohol dehydrogenase family)
VLLGARNQTLGKEAAAKLRGEGLDVCYLAMDLHDPPTISAAADHIDADFGRLDILVNNAGIAAEGDGPPSTSSLNAIERAFRVNFIRSVAVTQALLPDLRKAPSARMSTCPAASDRSYGTADPASPYAGFRYFGYGASKAALNMFTAQLASELRDTPAIKVNSAEPGYTATDLNHHRGTQTIPEGAAEVIRLALLPGDGPTATFSDRNSVVPR